MKRQEFWFCLFFSSFFSFSSSSYVLLSNVPRKRVWISTTLILFLNVYVSRQRFKLFPEQRCNKIMELCIISWTTETYYIGSLESLLSQSYKGWVIRIRKVECETEGESWPAYLDHAEYSWIFEQLFFYLDHLHSLDFPYR